jgi:hypothetical protein
MGALASKPSMTEARHQLVDATQRWQTAHQPGRYRLAANPVIVTHLTVLVDVIAVTAGVTMIGLCPDY